MIALLRFARRLLTDARLREALRLLVTDNPNVTGRPEAIEKEAHRLASHITNPDLFVMMRIGQMRERRRNELRQLRRLRELRRRK